MDLKSEAISRNFYSFATAVTRLSDMDHTPLRGRAGDLDADRLHTSESVSVLDIGPLKTWRGLGAALLRSLGRSAKAPQNGCAQA